MNPIGFESIVFILLLCNERLFMPKITVNLMDSA